MDKKAFKDTLQTPKLLWAVTSFPRRAHPPPILGDAALSARELARVVGEAISAGARVLAAAGELLSDGIQPCARTTSWQLLVLASHHVLKTYISP